MHLPTKTILLFLTLFTGSFIKAQVKDSFVLVKKGEYSIGKKNFIANPLRKVKVDGFYIAIYETTNSQFAAFVSATGHVTDAEQKHDALVFEPGLKEFEWMNDSTAN